MYASDVRPKKEAPEEAPTITTKNLRAHEDYFALRGFLLDAKLGDGEDSCIMVKVREDGLAERIRAAPQFSMRVLCSPVPSMHIRGETL